MRRVLLAALIVVGFCAPASAAYQITDIACETTTTAGTGTIDLGGALTGGWLGFAAAGISTGNTVPYEITDGTQIETGHGVFTTGTPDTLTRVADWSTDGSGAELTLSGGTATVCIGPIASVWTGGSFSPYFSTIELGAASDTTLSRSAAGVLAVEGADVVMGTVGSTDNALVTANGTGTHTVQGSVGGATLDDSNNLNLGTSAAVTLGTIELGAASDTTIARSAAGAGTIEGKAIKNAGKQTLWIPAGAFAYDASSDGAVTQAVTHIGFERFNSIAWDTSTAGWSHFNIVFPKNWDEGTITFTPYWTATSGSGGVVWSLACVAITDDDAFPSGWGTAQTSTDTLTAANDLDVGPESSAITIGSSPAVGDNVHCEITRNTGDANDTLGTNAILVGVMIHYTDDAANDN